MTHQSFRLNDFAPLCEVQMLISGVLFLVMLSVSFPWRKHSTYATCAALRVILVVQSFISSLRNWPEKKENKCSYWTTESHEAFNPLVSSERNPMIVSVFTVHRLCVYEPVKLVNQLHCMSSHIWQPIHLKPRPRLSCSFSILVNGAQPHHFEVLLPLFTGPITLRCSPCSHSILSCINHLWLRSLHHNRNLPHHAFPLPSLTPRTYPWTLSPGVDNESKQVMRFWFYTYLYIFQPCTNLPSSDNMMLILGFGDPSAHNILNLDCLLCYCLNSVFPGHPQS